MSALHDRPTIVGMMRLTGYGTNRIPKEGKCQYGNGWPVPRSRSSRSSRSPSSRAARPRPPRRGRRRSRWPSSPTSAASTTRASTRSPTTASRSRSASTASGPRLHLEERGGLRPEPLDGRQQGYNLVIAVGFLMGDSTAAVAKKFPKTKFAIIDVNARRPEGQAEERPRHRLRRAGGGLPRRRRGRDGLEVRHDLVGRRPQDPARRRVHRRLPVLRQEGEAGHQDAQRRTRRTSSPRTSARRSRSTRSARARRRLPGRRRLRPRRPRGGEGLERLGHRRRHRPGVPRHARCSRARTKKVDAGVIQTIKLVKDGKSRAASTVSST